MTRLVREETTGVEGALPKETAPAERVGRQREHDAGVGVGRDRGEWW